MQLVCKSKNRKDAYEYLVDNYSLDIIISDDGSDTLQTK